MTRIKVCGLREVEHALVAADLGADYLGAICWPGSKRYADRGRLRAIADALRSRYDYQRRPLLVGVFVNQPDREIAEVVEICGLDLVQLHGDEPWDAWRSVPVPVIRALRVAADRHPLGLIGELHRETPNLLAAGGRVLIESLVAGQYGGTGQTANWGLAAEVARHHEFMLSGGLTPENVATAIRGVRPWAVDVSSGVESDGVKDVTKIRAFIEAVRAADQALSATAAAAR